MINTVSYILSPKEKPFQKPYRNLKTAYLVCTRIAAQTPASLEIRLPTEQAFPTNILLLNILLTFSTYPHNHPLSPRPWDPSTPKFPTPAS